MSKKTDYYLLYNKLKDDKTISKEEKNNIIDDIIKNGGSHLLYWIGRDIDNVDLYKIQNELVNRQDGHYLARFIMDVKALTKEQREKLEDILIKAQEYSAIYEILLHFKNENKEKLLDAFLQDNFINFNYRGDWLIELAKRNHLYIERIKNELIKNKDYENLIEFLFEIQRVNTEKLEEFILTTDNAPILISYCLEVKGADISKIENRLIEIGTSKDLIEFIKIEKRANKEKIKKHIKLLITKEIKNRLQGIDDEFCFEYYN